MAYFNISEIQNTEDRSRDEKKKMVTFNGKKKK